MQSPHPGITVDREPDPWDSTRWVIRGTVDSLLAAGKNYAATGSNRRRLNSVRETLADRQEWYGMAEDAILALRDWPDGLSLIDKCRLGELPAPTSTQRKQTWADTGDDFCRDRFDSGLDECWSTRKRAVRPASRVVKLTCQVGGLVHLTADELVWAGAVAAAVTDQAEAAGYRVEVEAISSVTNAFTDGTAALTIVAIKSADEPINLSKLVMALACPAFFRWYVMQSRTLAGSNVTKGYGATASVPYKYRGELHVSACYSQWQAQYEAGRLLRQLERLNQPEEEPDTYVPLPPKSTVVDATPTPTYTPPEPPRKPAKPVKAPAPVYEAC